MIHIRTDNETENSKRAFACGIGPSLPKGDKWVDQCRAVSHHLVDCPGCIPFREEFGTPLSQLSGQPGKPGYDRFCEIATSWGHE